MPRGRVAGLPERSCGLKECSARYTPGQPRQRFCCDEHRIAAHSLRRFLDDLEAAVKRRRLLVATADGAEFVPAVAARLSDSEA